MRMPTFPQRDTLFAIHCFSYFKIKHLQHIPEQIAVCPDILDDQNAVGWLAGRNAFHLADTSFISNLALAGLFDRNGEGKNRAFAHFTLHLNSAAHHRNKLLADRQPKPGTFINFLAALGLDEGFKNTRTILLRYANTSILFVSFAGVGDDIDICAGGVLRS